MAENIFDSVGNMTAFFLGKSRSVLFGLLISYMTDNREMKRCSTNLGVLEKVDLQMKVF